MVVYTKISDIILTEQELGNIRATVNVLPDVILKTYTYPSSIAISCSLIYGDHDQNQLGDYILMVLDKDLLSQEMGITIPSNGLYVVNTIDPETNTHIYVTSIIFNEELN